MNGNIVLNPEAAKKLEKSGNLAVRNYYQWLVEKEARAWEMLEIYTEQYGKNHESTNRMRTEWSTLDDCLGRFIKEGA